MKNKRTKRRKYAYRRNNIWPRPKKYRYGQWPIEQLIKIVAFIVMLLLVIFLLSTKNGNTKELMYTPTREKIAAFEISPAIINRIFQKAGNQKEEVSSLLASYIVGKEKGKEDGDILTNIGVHKPGFFASRRIKKMYKEARKCYEQFITDVKIFPIPPGYEYVYENSWNAERTYGGIRRHYGTDVMDPENIRGNIPILSISQGTIESIGWNNMGGYRVGVRTRNGGYIYYAHLDKYAPKLKKGSKLEVGDCIGYMGDSGYGKEGTVGEFPVHLHIGIATKALGSKEAWVNPYYILKYLEDNIYDIISEE